jgi:hypothetical protein
MYYEYYQISLENALTENLPKFTGFLPNLPPVYQMFGKFW